MKLLQQYISRMMRQNWARFNAGSLALVCAIAAMSRLLFAIATERSAGRILGQQTRRHSYMIGKDANRVTVRVFVTAATVLSIFMASAAMAETPPGTMIPNTVTLTYEVSGAAQPPISDTAYFSLRHQAIIEFWQYHHDPDEATPFNLSETHYLDPDGNYQPLPSGTLPPIPPGLTNPVPLNPAERYRVGEPIYILVTDLDQNLHPDTYETVEIIITGSNGDTEWLRLTETGPNTGQFVGYIASTADDNGHNSSDLTLTANSAISVSYTDIDDHVQTVVANALVDPYGVVFDSTTGQPVDGATITLINTDTNQPAEVFGEDGAPNYPSTLISGQPIVHNGITYDYDDGSYHFPLIPPGNYKLVIVPPGGYINHATTTDFAVLQQLPGAPFALSDASIGIPFLVTPGPAIHIDIPLDPAPSQLWLRKEANKDKASPGDFVQYSLMLENLGSTVASSVILNDRLPLGFRYQRGSTRTDGRPTANPTISADGRTLVFQPGDLAPGGTVSVSYVVEVSAGAKPGKAVNQAVATSGSASSNVARAVIEIEDDFFRRKTFLLGRVMLGSCDMDNTEMPGLEGVRVYLEDGSYNVTDKEGKYHFEGLDPGVHVVQVDLETVRPGYQLIPCEESSQFAGRTFSQFVDLKGGTLWRADFYAAEATPPSGEMTLQLRAGLKDSTATYTAHISAETLPADNLRVTMILPGAASYVPGSARMGDAVLPDPVIIGGSMTFTLAHLPAGETRDISADAKLDTGTGSAELPAKAILTFNTETAKNQRTPIADVNISINPATSREEQEIKLYPRFPSLVAELQPTDLVMLDQLVTELKDENVRRVDIVGHTDDDTIFRRSQHIHADNQALSVARARTVAQYLQERLDIPDELVTVRGVGDKFPIADNNSQTGKTLNRRVELNILTTGGSDPAEVEITKGTSDVQRVKTTGASPASRAAQETIATLPDLTGPPEVNGKWLSKLRRGTKIVWPEAGYTPVNPSTTVMVQHPVNSKVTLTINGELVPRLNFDTKKPLPNGEESLSIWDGVDLTDDRNLIEATITAAGKTEHLSTETWYVSEIKELALIPEQSALIADGITTPTIALRLTGEGGKPVRPGMKLSYKVSQPYKPSVDDFDDTERNPGTGTMTTGAGGLAIATLVPTAQSGEVTIEIPGHRELKASTWLKPAPRDWILVGFAQGTVGYSTFSGNQVSLEEAGIDEHFYDDGEVKFFAKGAIKGEWLLTMAYDSDKPDLDGDTLHQTIDPDTYYPLYGDGTRQGYEAASASDIFIKLERDQFYALFGDMDTGLTQTELSRYSRSMNGIKSEMQTDKFSYTVFAADTKQSFEKDEIRGDGTSGRYYLSTSDLVINSEEVIIETRDRFRSERIIDSRTLSRHTDYDIDYNAGSLFFKQPVPSKDKNFNPVFIVVNYETESSNDENLNYGGRAAVKLLDKKVEVGASYIHEDRGAGKGNLYGVDATVNVTAKTIVHLEAATTDTEFYGVDEDGDAYLAEVRHDNNRLNSLAYFREQQESFGLGQQNGSESGTRKYGAEATYHFTPKVSATGLAYHEDVLSTGAERDVAEIRGRYQEERYSLHSGLREARDKFADGEKQQSTQWLIGGDWLTPDRKLRLRSDYEQSLGSKNKNTDFPTLLTLGADYQVSSRISVFTEQVFSWGDKQDTEGTRAGFRATPWDGGDLSSTVERSMSENGERVFALFGLGQTWQVSPNLSVDAMLDRSYTIKSPDYRKFNNNVPAAYGGDEDFTSLSAGTTYRQERWTLWNRLETRQGDNEDKYGVSSSVVAEPQDGVAVSAKALAFITEGSKGIRRTDGNIRLGMAYRPTSSRWIVLNRLDFYFDKEDHSSDEYDNWRIVNNIHANFRLSRRTQMSFYYGFKYVRDSYNGKTYSGYTDLVAFEQRYNINKKWDVGVHGSALHSWNSNNFDYSAGVDIGFSPMTNTWISLGYNVTGFEDEDFSAAHYTAQGVYIRFRVKFDQQSAKAAAQWLNR